MKLKGLTATELRRLWQVSPLIRVQTLHSLEDRPLSLAKRNRSAWRCMSYAARMLGAGAPWMCPSHLPVYCCAQ